MVLSNPLPIDSRFLPISLRPFLPLREKLLNVSMPSLTVSRVSLNFDAFKAFSAIPLPTSAIFMAFAASFTLSNLFINVTNASWLCASLAKSLTLSVIWLPKFAVLSDLWYTCNSFYLLFFLGRRYYYGIDYLPGVRKRSK